MAAARKKPERSPAAGAESDPFEIQLGMAVQLQHAGRAKDAERIYRRVLAASPGHPGAQLGLGILLQKRGEDSAALVPLQAALEAQPRSVEARFALGVSLGRLRRYEEAVRHLEAAAVGSHPGLPEVLNQLGITLAQLGRTREAERQFQRAIRQRPGFAEPHKNLGTLYAELGRLPEAQAEFRKAIALRPDYSRAWWHLAHIRSFTAQDPELHALEGLYARRDLTDEQRMDIAFALGKASHELGQHQRAFGYWREANLLARRRSRYDVRPALAEMRAMQRLFAAGLSPQPPVRDPGGPVPLFIVGMPRSGTSLVEQILASHPAVHGAGELALVDDLLRAAAPRFPDDLRRLDGAGWQAIADEYARSVGELAGEARFVTDKMPANFLHLGAILGLFGRARVIHCRRDAMDTALSCYRTHFTWDKLGYTTDLTELGAYFRHYEELMAHWRSVAGAADPDAARLYEVRYEALVADPEPEIRKLLEFCGLPFDAACLEFHRNRRRVRTASGAQVRQPLYTAAVGGARAYERELAPFRRVLESRWRWRMPRLAAWVP